MIYSNKSVMMDEAGFNSSSETISSFNFGDNFATTVSKEKIDLLRDRLVKESRKQTQFIHDSSKKELDDLLLPPEPQWVHERPYLSLNYIHEEKSSDSIGPLGELPVSSQEHSLISDVLNLMTGCSGTYISVVITQQAVSFDVDSSIEPHLTVIINRILPICEYYSRIQRFIETRRCSSAGKVNHALVSAMKSLIKDYVLLVTQLETQHLAGSLTLQRLWFYIEKTMGTMEVLSSLAIVLSKPECRGGVILSLLYDRLRGLRGCGHLEDLLVFLIEASAVPYMSMLSLWIYKGLIADPYNEFMVQDNEKMTKNSRRDLEEDGFEEDDHYDDYWEKRYSLSPENVPLFLKPHAENIMKTGKYLNVIRDSDSTIACLECKDITYKIQMESFDDIVEEALKFASKRLLELLIKEKGLLGHLKSIKHYFLLDQGDFVTQLLSATTSELNKNIDDVIPNRLESLLELTLRTSSVSEDLHRDDVHCTLLPYSLMSQLSLILSVNTEEEREYRNPPDRLNMSGLEGFALSYHVQWPLLLIIEQKSHFCYQMIFRHLFFCKYVEGLLRRVWMSNKVAKEFQVASAATYRKAFMLSQRMIYFVQNLQYYMYFEVIERYWQIFMSNFEKVENVDDVLLYHSNFLNGCMQDCMLKSRHLLSIIIKLLKLCIDFSNFILRMRNYFVDAEFDVHPSPEREQFSLSPEPMMSRDVDSSESFEQTTARFDLQFTGMIVTLMDKISDEGRDNFMDALIHALCRLDFNNFYQKKTRTLSSCGSPEDSVDTNFHLGFDKDDT